MSSPNFTPTPEFSDDLTNQPFGDYQILRRIGSGAMSEVYVAQQISLGRRVAVKILKQELATDETYVKRFIREAQAAARLVHPNIVHIYEVGERQGIRYIVQEYVQGSNLSQFLQQNGAMSPKQVFLVMWQVASALELASSSGIVHRDIKPENILLGEQLKVKVADFGLARVDDFLDQELQLTKIGMTLGTPLYMSPEQSEGKPLDHRSDIYSFGITCYHILAGFPPFRGETALSVAIQHLKTAPEMLEVIRPDIPPQLARIVHQMIAKSPEERYQSLRQIKVDLKQLHALVFQNDSPSEILADWDSLPLDVVDSSLIATTEKLQMTMVFEAKSQKTRRKKWGMVALGMVLLFLGGAAFGLQKEGPQKLLELEKLAFQIPSMETVHQQWALASMRQTPEAWQSVITHFPKETYWTGMAKRQLAWYHFDNGQPEKAKLLFIDFTKSAQPEDVFIGNVGLAWVNAEEGNLEESQRLLKMQIGSIPQGSNAMASDMLAVLRLKYKMDVPQLLEPKRPMP